MERVKGIEPSYEAWEAAVLPLNYTRNETDFTPAVDGRLNLLSKCSKPIHDLRGDESGLFGEWREGLSPQQNSPRSLAQNGSDCGSALPPLRYCYRDLMSDFAVIVLRLKR